MIDYTTICQAKNTKGELLALLHRPKKKLLCFNVVLKGKTKSEDASFWCDKKALEYYRHLHKSFFEGRLG